MLSVNIFAQKNRLLLTLGLILSFGFLGISLLGFIAAQNAIRSNIVNQSLPLAGDTVYSEVQRQLLRPIFISAQMAQNTFLRDWVLSGENNSTAVTKYLKSIKNQFETNTSFFISDLTRKYYYSDGILKTINPTDSRDQWYYNFKKSKLEYELSSDPDEAHKNRMTIFINYRLENEQGKLLGVTGVGVTFDALNKLVVSLEKRFSQKVYFIDKTGKIMLADSTRLENKKTIQEIQGLSALANKILSRKNIQQNAFTRNNNLVQVNSRFVPELGWYLLVEQDEGAATQPVLRLLLVNLLLGALATALVLGLTVMAVNQYQRRLEKLATIDSLTEAKTRSLGEILLEQTNKETLRENKPFSLIMFDIDNFKHINDSYGHPSGDKILREVVQLSQTVIRNTDIIVRWGGEEFLIILKNCHLEDAQRIAQELQQSMATHAFLILSKNIQVTISVGVAQLESNETLTQFLKRTDDAQYNAKKNGKNRVAVARLAQMTLL
jgi:diguanylate cyclase (GGDEF)-like protein